MRIVDIREKTVSLAAPMRSAGLGFGEMTGSALVLVSDVVRGGRPLVGLAFDSIGRYAHGGLLRERFMPRLLGAAPDEYADGQADSIDPVKVWSIVMRNEKPGGHGERSGAVGLIDAAAWDLAAKTRGKPLWRVLADRYRGGRAETRVPVYGSGGHYRPGDDLARLRDEIRACLDLGYTRVKIKIGGADLSTDLARIEAALAVLGGRGEALAVDSNGTFGRRRAEAYVTALAAYGLAWLEEPADPLDFALLADICRMTAMPIATGENLFSAADTRNLLLYGGLRLDRDLLQMDISLSYGVVEYLRILDLIEGLGWSRRRCVPHAGHVLALNVCAGLGLGGHEAAADPGSIFGGYPDGTRIEGGYVTVADHPGVGIEHKPDLYAVFRDLLP